MLTDLIKLLLSEKLCLVLLLERLHSLQTWGGTPFDIHAVLLKPTAYGRCLNCCRVSFKAGSIRPIRQMNGFIVHLHYLLSVLWWPYVQQQTVKEEKNQLLITLFNVIYFFCHLCTFASYITSTTERDPSNSSISWQSIHNGHHRASDSLHSGTITSSL